MLAANTKRDCYLSFGLNISAFVVFACEFPNE